MESKNLIEKLVKPRVRRAVLVILLLLLSAMLLADFASAKISQEFLKSVAGTLSNGFASALMGILCAYVFFIIFTPEEYGAETEITSPSVTYARHQRELGRTNQWLHSGHTARWVTQKGMPILGQHASGSGRHIDVKLLVIDPANEVLCEEYAAHRRRLAANHFGGTWTTEHVQLEITCSIVRACRIACNHPRLNVDIRLSNDFDPRRSDITTDVLFMTIDDPKSIAVQISKDEVYYSYMLADFQKRFEKGRIIKPEFMYGDNFDLNSCISSNYLRIFSHEIQDETLKKILISLGNDKNIYD